MPSKKVLFVAVGQRPAKLQTPMFSPTNLSKKILFMLFMGFELEIAQIQCNGDMVQEKLYAVQWKLDK